jgi:hypothetical protein
MVFIFPQLTDLEKNEDAGWQLQVAHLFQQTAARALKEPWRDVSLDTIP